MLVIRKIFIPVIVCFFAGSALGQLNLPIDPKATKETVNLYQNLRKQAATGIMFGHQDDLAYGVGWKYQYGRSDVKDVTGDYPAVYGWELGRIELDNEENLDSVPFERMKQYIYDAYNRGGVITISWHLNNPLTGNSAWQPAPGSVTSVLPGGSKNEMFMTWLDNVAAFMQSLVGPKGELIPVIFRPFHEINGSWFWWGGKNCTPDEIKQLWHFTVNYLRNTKNVHNLLYAYNTDRFSSREAYLERYPGDEWVDITGFDIYQSANTKPDDFGQELDRTLGLLESISAEHKKIPALTEFGYNGLPDSTWWTRVFLKAIENHHIAYALAWRNAGYKSEGRFEYYVPYPGQTSAADFKKFYDNPRMIFQKKLSGYNIYK